MSFFPAGGLQELPFVIRDAGWPGGASGRSLIGSLAFGYMVGAGRTCQSVTLKSLPTPSSDYGKLLILPFFDVSDSDTSFLCFFSCKALATDTIFLVCKKLPYNVII